MEAVRRPTATALAATLAALVATLLAPQPARALSQAPDRLAAYQGFATWVDIYDTAVWRDPEAAVAAIAARGIGTVYLETSNYRQPAAILRRALVARFLEAAHGADLEVIAWYLPGFARPAVDVRRSLAALEFETATGQGFDGFALDIESSEVRSASRRTARLLRVVAEIRGAAGPDAVLGAIIPSPRGMELSPAYWPGFPYAELADAFQVFLPMVYFTYRTRARADTRDYVAASVKILRRETGDADVAIHVIGGVADRTRRGQLRGFADAVCADRLLGASLYDWETTAGRHWSQLTRLAACVPAA